MAVSRQDCGKWRAGRAPFAGSSEPGCMQLRPAAPGRSTEPDASRILVEVVNRDPEPRGVDHDRRLSRALRSRLSAFNAKHTRPFARARHRNGPRTRCLKPADPRIAERGSHWTESTATESPALEHGLDGAKERRYCRALRRPTDLCSPVQPSVMWAEPSLETAGHGG